MHWRSISLAAAMLLAASATGRAQEPVPSPALALPSPVQYVWHEQERIMFVCLDPCTWQGREYDDHSTPLAEMRLPELDTDQWCEAALSWGAREILFVAKHTGGFCWWRTDTTEYCVRNIGWRDGEGDLLVELARSCGEYGLNMGIYVYPGDETWGAGIGSGGKTRDPSKQAEYDEVFRTQLRESLTLAAAHTRVLEVWFDGSCVIEVGDVLAECAPEAVVFQGPHATIRWVGNEGGRLAGPQSWSTLTAEDLATGLATAHHGTPHGTAWAPLEVNTTLYAHHWFWALEKEAKRKSLDELLHVYYQSAGQGAVMLLNSTPTTDGLLPAGDVALYAALGREIERRFADPLAGTRGRGHGHVFTLTFDGPTLVNHTVVREDCLHGERIRSYVIEGWDGSRWEELCRGTAVGRKRIDHFPEAVVTALRLRVVEAAAAPLVAGFTAHHVTDFRPHAGAPAQSPWTQCGAWTAEELAGGPTVREIDLSPFLTEVGQWRVRFAPTANAPDLEIAAAVLLQQGQPSAPGALTRVEGEPLTLHVNRTAVITEKTDVRLRVTLRGARGDGVILIRCINP